jgi:hypothetical protein
MDKKAINLGMLLILLMLMTWVRPQVLSAGVRQANSVEKNEIWGQVHALDQERATLIESILQQVRDLQHQHAKDVARWTSIREEQKAKMKELQMNLHTTAISFDDRKASLMDRINPGSLEEYRQKKQKQLALRNKYEKTLNDLRQKEIFAVNSVHEKYRQERQHLRHQLDSKDSANHLNLSSNIIPSTNTSASTSISTSTSSNESSVLLR